MQTTLKVLMQGFQAFEERIIETTIHLNNGRSPSLELIITKQLNNAEIVFIDGKNDNAMEWADTYKKILAEKTVIWVDTDIPEENIKHTEMKRPIMWVNLPIILSRILDEQALRESEPELGSPDIKDNFQGNAKTILVVDDSKAVRDYLAKVLDSKNYSVVAVETGEEAIQAAQARYFDCVLMDVLMPGIDGYKACRAIRRLKQYKSIGPMPVIMLTSRTSPFDKIRGKMAGCNAYLTKPVKIVTLLTAVDKYANK